MNTRWLAIKFFPTMPVVIRLGLRRGWRVNIALHRPRAGSDAD